MRKTSEIRNLIICLSIVTLAFVQGNHPTAKKSEIIIVSNIGDPVSNSQSGPFQPASTAYLAGWEKPRFDGGLANYAFIKGATWIWMGDFIGDFQQPLYFPKIFYIPEGATDITGTLEITADNFFSFSINGLNYRGTGPPDRRQWANVYRFSITNLKPGENYLFITAYEVHPKTPSGLVYKLFVQYKEIPVVYKEDARDDFAAIRTALSAVEAKDRNEYDVKLNVVKYYNRKFENRQNLPEEKIKDFNEAAGALFKEK